MINDNGPKGHKRRHRSSNPEQKRTTGEQARNAPSMSVPGFTERELDELVNKLQMVSLAMKDWSPISKRRSELPDTDAADPKAQEDSDDAGHGV